MSTANKLTYLNDTKGLLKQKINNLGGDITDNTTFRQYAEQLQNVYDKFPKTSYAEGSNITLSNTLKGKLDFEDGIVGIGDTSQKSYQGYQLIPYTLETLKTLNTSGTWNGNVYSFEGVTYTVELEDGYIKQIKTTGTATATSFMYLINSLTISAGTYYVSGCPNGGSVSTYFIYAGSGLTHNTTDTPTATTLNEDVSLISNNLRITIINGTNANNLVWKPMLSKTNTTNFEPYVGGAPSPNPPYPQDIEVVRGKNRAYVNTSTSPNVSDFAKIEQGKTYTFSMKVNGSMSGVNLRYGENVIKTFYGASGNISHTFVAPITGTLNLNGYGVDNFNGYEEIQLEKGSQVTSYLPYNTIEIVESGKNIAYDSRYVSITNKYGGVGFCSYKLEEGKQYTISFDTDNSGIQVYRQSPNISGFNNPSAYNFTCDGTRKSFTAIGVEGTYTNIGIILRLSDTSDTPCSISNLMISELEDTTYEPYQTPTTHQLSLGEYEFAKIGNYADTIEYDVDEDKVYKNEKIGRNDFDENLSYEDFSAYWGQGSFGTRLTNIGTDKIAWSDMLCKYFVAYTSSETKNLNNEMVVGTSSMIFNNLNISTLTEWITWVTTHHFSVFYPKSTSTLIEITDTTLKTQVKALYNAHSNNGTTILESNGDLPMIIKVRALKGE